MWKQHIITSISIAARLSVSFRVEVPNVGNASIGWPWATRWNFPWWRGNVNAQTFDQSCKDEPHIKLLALSARG